jgi:hypothetical protein
VTVTSAIGSDVALGSTQARGIRLGASLTAALAYSGVLLQVGLSVSADANGYGPLGETLHILSFFTMVSNLVVAVVSTMLAIDPSRSGRWFDGLRLAALVMISVTGIVYWLLLAGEPTTGLDWVANMLVHSVVPVAAVGSWLLVGPHGRFRGGLLPLMLLIPVAWLVFAMLRGAISGYYPYFFMDVTEVGYAMASLRILGVVAFALIVACAYVGLDKVIVRLAAAYRR